MSWLSSMSESSRVMVVAIGAGTLVLGTCNATLIAERWAGSDNGVRAACVQRCGNPYCKPCGLAEEKARADVLEAEAAVLRKELTELHHGLRMSRCVEASKP
jgi:hypothetical protein